jgi:hypothetical protein
VTEGDRETYVRLQATYIGRLGVEVGIFVAVDHLRRTDRLSVDEENLYFDVDDWFQASLPHPPFYDDGNSIGAVTWFKKSTAQPMLERLAPLQAVLSKYAIEHDMAESADPGTIIYEDEFQVGVLPYRRSQPTPRTQGIVLGPTTSGSKRHLGKAGRSGPAQGPRP